MVDDSHTTNRGSDGLGTVDQPGAWPHHDGIGIDGPDRHLGWDAVEDETGLLGRTVEVVSAW